MTDKKESDTFKAFEQIVNKLKGERYNGKTIAEGAGISGPRLTQIMKTGAGAEYHLDALMAFAKSVGVV